MFTLSLRPPKSCLRIRTFARRTRRQRRAKAVVERPPRRSRSKTGFPITKVSDRDHAPTNPSLSRRIRRSTPRRQLGIPAALGVCIATRRTAIAADASTRRRERAL
jgi:hypothetical protein